MSPKGNLFQAGNPGRQPGARNRLSNKFLTDLLADWEQHGVEAIRIMRIESPGEYIRAVLACLPKAVSISTEDALQTYSDEELGALLIEARAKLVSERPLIEKPMEMPLERIESAGVVGRG